MKKRTVLILPFLILFISLQLYKTQHATAAGMSIGAYLWPAWWKPSFEDWMKGESKHKFVVNTFNKKFKMDLAPLYGPILSFKLSDKISFNNVLVMGSYRAKSWVRKLLNLLKLF